MGQRVVVTEPFDREELGPLDLRKGHEAGANGLSVQQHGTGATFPFPTTFLRPGQPALLAQHVEQPSHRVRVDVDRPAVERETHQPPAPIVAAIAVSGRRSLAGSASGIAAPSEDSPATGSVGAAAPL
jgi:hypothetical protein